MKSLAEAGVETASNLESLLISFNDALEQQFCHSRIFCVSENHDNVVMWSHYTDEHRGVVFKLACIDEIDNLLLAAKKVTYTDSFLKFPSAKDYVNHLTGEKPLNLVELCWKLAFTKHKDWAYENEWRVHMPLLTEPPGNGYSIFTENPKVFDSIYLGCRMSDDAATQLINTAKQHLPNTKIFHGSKSTKAFTHTFTEI